jgi:hypothetical protein
LKILTEGALPEYLRETIGSLKLVHAEDPVDLSAIFHELTTQLFGRMAYNVEILLYMFEHTVETDWAPDGNTSPGSLHSGF